MPEHQRALLQQLALGDASVSMDESLDALVAPMASSADEVKDQTGLLAAGQGPDWPASRGPRTRLAG